MRRSRLAKLPMVLIFLTAAAVGTGCGGQVMPPAQARSEPSHRPLSRGAAPAEDPRPPADALALADQMYVSRLGATRGQFDDDRQIAVLQQEVLLYTQFLERAEGQPELAPAVQKSRERIADAQATIEFLRKHQHDDAAAPDANTE